MASLFLYRENVHHKKKEENTENNSTDTEGVLVILATHYNQVKL